MLRLALLIISSIIAIHGLNPPSKNDADQAWDTWRKPAGPHGRLWLRDDLPQYFPQSRIFLCEYNSTLAYGKNRDIFAAKAEELLEAIRLERRGVRSRPILFLGHSIGGLLIKQALINAHKNPLYTPIKDSTIGLVFFATPHHATRSASLGWVVAKIAAAVGFKKGSDVFETLKSGNIFSEIMRESWRDLWVQYYILSFRGALDQVS